jgi:hypothetical protein
MTWICKNCKNGWRVLATAQTFCTRDYARWFYQTVSAPVTFAPTIQDEMTQHALRRAKDGS